MNKNYTQGFALIVGVGADLPNTIDDAEGIANLLKDSSRCAYPPEQVHLLTGEKATRNHIISTLEHLSQTSNSESTVVIYFSGHGYSVISPTGEFYYLMSYGYDLNQLYQTAINGNEFAEKLKAIPAKKLLILLDCCHAGGFSDTKVPGLQLTKSALPLEAQTILSQGSGRVIIASSQEDELSYAGKPYSAFTLALIESFCGIGVAKKDGYVRVTDLALHAREVVPKRTSDQQHPILHFEEADNFVVAYYAGGETQSKDLPFDTKPEIKLSPEVQTAFNQSGQKVDSQTNIAGDVHGSILSGKFEDSVEVGKQENVKVNGGFYQPKWEVKGNVNQAQGDIVSVSGETNRKDKILMQVFTDLMQEIKSLPVDDQELIKSIAKEIQELAQKIQQGFDDIKTQEALEKRLRSLRVMSQDLGEKIITELAEQSINLDNVIQAIVQRVQIDLSSKSE